MLFLLAAFGYCIRSFQTVSSANSLGAGESFLPSFYLMSPKMYLLFRGMNGTYYSHI